jgi:hypothetical protein
MPTILSKVIGLLTGSEAKPSDWLKVPKHRPLQSLTERELINLEAEIGLQLFGPIPKGHRREFFCLDAATWIWHEEWVDEQRKLQTATTRYEVQDQGILKVQEGARYSYLEGQELKNFSVAINMYYERVMREIYHRDPDTGVAL